MSTAESHTTTVLIRRPRAGHWKNELATVNFWRNGRTWYASCYTLQLRFAGEEDEPLESVERQLGLQILPFVVEQPA